MARGRTVKSGEAILVSCASVVVLGVALLVLAFEGAVGLFMAAPIAIPLAILGA